MSVAFRWIDTKHRYLPKLTGSDDYAESPDEYCRRMESLLPRFPASVLTQWFYDHWAQIDDYAWLDFESLEFGATLWTTDQVLSSGIKANRSVQVDQQHYERGVTNPRIERIAAHFASQGTWPVAPIFVANPAGGIVRPDGFRLTSPYHLLEGSHRAALFCSFSNRDALKPEHEVWVAAVPDG